MNFLCIFISRLIFSVFLFSLLCLFFEEVGVLEMLIFLEVWCNFLFWNVDVDLLRRGDMRSD